MPDIWDWVNQFESTRYWMESLANRAETTKKEYLYKFRAFCDWLGMTPDELLEKRKNHLESKDRRIQHQLENKLKAYIAYREKEGMSYGMQKGAYGAVRSFFDNNYQPLDLRRSDAPSGENIGKRIPERKEVKQLMAVATSLRDRALISFAKDCGWRLGDIAELTWGDIHDMGEGFWNFRKITKKKRVKAQGFVGHETTELMALYRQKRERGTKGDGRGKGYPGIPPENITDTSPLFVAYNPRKKNRFQPLSAKRMSHVISEACSLIELDDVSAHSLRKYFQSSLEDPKLHIHKTWIKQFMGKKIVASDRPYVENRLPKLFEAYKMAYTNLALVEPLISREELKEEILSVIPDELLKPIAEKHGLPLERVKRIWRISARSGKNIETLLKQQTEESNEENDCPNGEHCSERFEEINESDLLQYLRQGWQIVHRREDGRVIVKR